MPQPVAEALQDPVHGVSYTFTRDGENLVVDTWLEPGGGLPTHYHPIQEEHWSVVEGEVEVTLDGKKTVMRPADGAAIVKPNMRHALANKSGATVHARCHVYPALSLEEFLTDSSRAAQEGLIMKGGIPKGLKGARWGATFLKRHRAETVMTFPPRFMQSAMIALFARRD
jgi:quercetin dioxygenase-like cupin family protein